MHVPYSLIGGIPPVYLGARLRSQIEIKLSPGLDWPRVPERMAKPVCLQNGKNQWIADTAAIQVMTFSGRPTRRKSV